LSKKNQKKRPVNRNLSNKGRKSKLTELPKLLGSLARFVTFKSVATVIIPSAVLTSLIPNTPKFPDAIDAETDPDIRIACADIFNTPLTKVRLSQANTVQYDRTIKLDNDTFLTRVDGLNRTHPVVSLNVHNERLEAMKRGNVKFNIESGGGSKHIADIYTTHTRHYAKQGRQIGTHVEQFAASAATFYAFSAPDSSIASTAKLLLHSIREVQQSNQVIAGVRVPDRTTFAEDLEEGSDLERSNNKMKQLYVDLSDGYVSPRCINKLIDGKKDVVISAKFAVQANWMKRSEGRNWLSRPTGEAWVRTENVSRYKP